MNNKEKINNLLNNLKKELKNYDDVNILNDLLELRISEVEKNLLNNKKYNLNSVKIYKLYEKIEKKIKDKKIINLLDEWMCLVNENNYYGNEIYYKLGINDGICIVTKLFEEGGD